MTFAEAITRNAFNSVIATDHSAAIGAQMLRDKATEEASYGARPGYMPRNPRYGQTHAGKESHSAAWAGYVAERNGNVLASLTAEPMTVGDIQKLTGLQRTPVRNALITLLLDGLVGVVTRSDGRPIGYFSKGAAKEGLTDGMEGSKG